MTWHNVYLFSVEIGKIVNKKRNNERQQKKLSHIFSQSVWRQRIPCRAQRLSWIDTSCHFDEDVNLQQN